MSTVLSHESEQLITCPYDPVHRIMRKRMQTHIIRCRQQYPNETKIPCIYNSTHLIPEPEMKFHLDTCKDRKNIDKHVYSTADVDHNKFQLPNVDVEFTEKWDDNHKSYDPTTYCENNPVLRTVSTLSAAKRKDFRYNERKRIQGLQNNLHTGVKEVIKSNKTKVRTPADMSEALTIKNVKEEDPYQVESLISKIDRDIENVSNNIGNISISTKGNDAVTEKNSDTDYLPSESDAEVLPLKDANKDYTNRDNYINDFPPLQPSQFCGGGAKKKQVNSHRGRGRRHF